MTSPRRFLRFAAIYIRRDGVIPPYKIDSATDEIRRCHAQQRANELRNTVMLRLRRAADMCSGTVSDTANMRIHGAQSASMRKKKSSAAPLFRGGRRSLIFAVPSKGNGSQEGRNRRCLPFCPRGVGTPSPAGSENCDVSVFSLVPVPK